jgi:hypothetical protein
MLPRCDMTINVTLAEVWLLEAAPRSWPCSPPMPRMVGRDASPPLERSLSDVS